MSNEGESNVLQHCCEDFQATDFIFVSDYNVRDVDIV